MNLEGMVRKGLERVRPYRPGKPIEEVRRELGLEEIYKLASNENPIGPSPKAVEAIKASLGALNRYPDASCYYLRRKLADFYGLAPDNFIIGNGSDEIIVLTLRAFLSPGEEVIVSRPTFLIYQLASQIEGAELKLVPMKNFKYDLEAILKAVSQRSKIIFIANPDNPSGTYLNRKEVEEFIAQVPEKVLLFFDEAYYELLKLEDFPQTIKFIQLRPLIVTRTFSKAYGLAGLRIGYGIADRELVSYLDRVREPFNVNSLAQVAAAEALEDQEFVERVKQVVEEGRRYLSRELLRLGLEYVDSCTNFILVKIGKKATQLVDFLLKRGLIVRAMSDWGLDEYIRITVGKDYENQKLVMNLEEFIKKEGER